MIRLLLLVAVLVVLLAPARCLGETDYVARDLIKKMDKRLELVERGPTIRVQSTPGGSLTTIPGYTSLELLAAGSVSMTPTAPSSGVARVVVSSSGGIYDSSSPGDTTNYWARKNGTWVSFSPSEYPAYLYVSNGITIGTNVTATLPGTLRWNPLTTNLQVHDGSGWTNLASGSSGGTGSGLPLAANGDLNGFSLTNGSSLRATSGVFQSTSAGVLTASGATLGATTINGDLTVNGTRYENEVVTTTTGTNVHIGVVTTLVSTIVYATQVVYQTTLVNTQVVTTNTVNTFVNIGGSFTMGSNSTFDATNANVVKFPGVVSTNGTNGATTTITGTLDIAGANVVGMPSQGVTNIALGGGILGDGRTNALAVDWSLETDPKWTAASGAVVSVAGGPTNYISGRFPVWNGTEWVQSAFVPAASTGSVSSLNGGIGDLSIAAGNGVTISASADPTNRILTVTSANAFRDYTEIDASSGLGTITNTSPLWLSFQASDKPRTLAMGTGFNVDQTWRFYVKIGRGTNTFSIDTNLTGYAFLSLPVSSTNHILIDRYPGDTSFRVLQVYR